MRSVALFLFMMLPWQAFAATNQLENEHIRLEVSTENGSIIHIVDKKTNVDYIGDAKATRLFRLLLPRPDYLARRINSWEQKAKSIDVKDGNLEIRFQNPQISRQRYYFQSGIMDVAEPQVDIDVTVTFRLDGRHILGKIQVENRTLDEITDVTFPWVSGLAQDVKGKPPKAVLPSLADKALPAAAAGGMLLGERFRRYPALLATTWVNYELSVGSIGIEALSTPETQDAFISVIPGDTSDSPSYGSGPLPLYIAWNFYPHIGGGTSWTSPETLIHVHDSDWHTIASEHREWHREHRSPPQSTAFDRAIGFATYRLKRHDNNASWTYDELPKLAEQAETAGIRVLVVDGWRQQEGDGNPCPFGETADPRIGGAPKLKSLIESLRQKGTELVFSFHPTLLDTASKEYKEGAQRWAVKTRRQANQLPPAYTFYTYDYPYEPQASHYWAVVDPSTAATDYLLQEAKRLRDEYGFRNLFLRGVGLQSFLSYNKYAPATPQKVYEFGYRNFLGGLKDLYPQGILMMEGLNDLVNSYASAGYTWNQAEGAEVLSYSFPWVPFSNDVEALDYDQANASFARKILINLIVDGGDGTVGRYAEFASHLKALQALKEKTAAYYADAEFRDHEGLKKSGADPESIVSTFVNRSTKQTGIVLANLASQKKRLALELDTSSMATKGQLFRLNGQQESIELAPSWSVELGPYEVAILGIEQGN